jgi:hypothetical protein
LPAKDAQGHEIRILTALKPGLPTVSSAVNFQNHIHVAFRFAF